MRPMKDTETTGRTPSLFGEAPGYVLPPSQAEMEALYDERDMWRAAAMILLGIAVGLGILLAITLSIT